MTSSKALNAQTAYLDFAQFNKLRKEYRDDADSGIKATARQLEGVFLNMMLKSMRQANSGFAEGSYLDSQDSEYFRDMYDQQLTLTLSARGGIGLADAIVRQMKQMEGHEPEDVKNDVPLHQQQKSYDISAYRERAIPALLRPELSSAEMSVMESDMEKAAPESQVFAPANTAANPRQAVAPASWQTPEEFVDAIMPHAEKAGKALNVDPMAIVAQAVLETGWGQHVMQNGNGQPSFNLFGIKASAAWEGDTVNKRTLEYRNGIAASESAAFRSYQSLNSAFDDYVKFLKENPRYKNAFTLNSEAKQWGYNLQNAGYATDPNYGNKIASLLESDILQAKSQSTTTSL